KYLLGLSRHHIFANIPHIKMKTHLFILNVKKYIYTSYIHHSLRCLSDCLQVIRHLRTNRSCGSALTTSVLEQTQPGGADKEPCLPQNRPPPRPVRSLSCFQCNAMFKTKAELLSHQRTHRARPIYHCTYGSLTGLQSHRATHTVESRFLCSQCGKRFKTRDGLEGHLRTHTGERPYRCPYCSKDFTALAGLNVHVRRHTGERPYVCTVCGKGWPSGGDLQKHMRTHTGERPYVCQDCGKAFSISSFVLNLKYTPNYKPLCLSVVGIIMWCNKINPNKFLKF
uniref:C2H2-type domain-containing protein n=1 Tax=Haplochromis burtoni TaxID=8153 RepID=A0A3Q2UZY6_HAPBU